MKRYIITALAVLTTLIMSAQGLPESGMGPGGMPPGDMKPEMAPPPGKGPRPDKKKDAKPKKEKKKKAAASAEDLYFRKGKNPVFLFGVSQMLTDSIVFITNIQQVDSIDVDKKTTTLPYRTELSSQFKDYLESKRFARNQTSCVFFNDKRKKLSKQFYKIKKRYLDDSTTKIIIIDDEKFRFTHPLDAYLNE